MLVHHCSYNLGNTASIRLVMWQETLNGLCACTALHQGALQDVWYMERQMVASAWYPDLLLCGALHASRINL